MRVYCNPSIRLKSIAKNAKNLIHFAQELIPKTVTPECPPIFQIGEISLKADFNRGPSNILFWIPDKSLIADRQAFGNDIIREGFGIA